MRQACSHSPACFYNHQKKRWYCLSCKKKIGDDPFNIRLWKEKYPDRLYPMFETRDEITQREVMEKGL